MKTQQYLMILGLYTWYPTYSDLFHISLQLWVIVQQPSEGSLTTDTHKVIYQFLYSRDSGNDGEKVSLESCCNQTNELRWQ